MGEEVVVELRKFGGEQVEGQLVGSGGAGGVAGQKGEGKRPVEQVSKQGECESGGVGVDK